VQGQIDLVAGRFSLQGNARKIMTMTTKSTTRVVHRSSVDGQFVKPSYVKTHPNTTETERVRVPAPAPTPPKKHR